MINTQPFELPFATHVLQGDSYEKRRNTIVLHGAGKSSRVRFSRMRERLNDYSIPTVSFDFIGHGETGGEITSTSLQGRTDQAEAVIRHTCMEPLTLIAASMSAYTAIKLTEIFSVNNLVLLVPAVYTPQAYHLTFGPEFSASIRAPDSWQDSDAFSILEEFQGSLLAIAAEHDSVIPRKVIEKIHESAKHAITNIVHTVPDSEHLSLFPKDEDFNFTLNMIAGICNGRDKYTRIN